MIYHDEPESGICDECGEACQATPVDFGIGPYEFWGDRGTHRDIHMLSPCCEAAVVPGGCREIADATHVARRDHKDGKVKAGQRYRRIVRKHWRQDGPMWFTEEKRILTS